MGELVFLFSLLYFDRREETIFQEMFLSLASFLLGVIQGGSRTHSNLLTLPAHLLSVSCLEGQRDKRQREI